MLFERYSSFCLLLLYFSSQSGLGSSYLNECNRPLGLQDGRISNSQLLSPTHFEHFYIGHGKTVNLKPEFARLNNTLAWCSPVSKKYSNSTYIEIDLKQRAEVSGIATQGFRGINAYYVKQYKVSYSNDQVTWKPFKELWTGNSDAQTVVKNTFNPAISARFVRIYPITYNFRVCMRIELYGCRNVTVSASPGLPVNPTPTVTVPSTVENRRQSTTTSSLHVTPTLSSVKAVTPTPSSILVKNQPPSAVSKMKEPLHTTTVKVPWSVVSRETVVVAQTDKGVGEKHFLGSEPEHVQTSVVIALSITAAFTIIVMVPVFIYLMFLRQRKHRRCKRPSSGDYGIPLATAVIDENLCNQELYDTYVYGVPKGKCNAVEMNFLNQCHCAV
ncbi:hypothetical protein ACROYT_G038556 [Oculina patagonica]